MWPTGTNEEKMLNQTQVEILFALDMDSYQTLLNPLNVKEFFRLYEENLVPSIMQRFSLT
jgi:hypothetical protein